MRDQNLGAWSFAYDAAGRLTSQVDAIGQTTCFAYDAIGRMTAKNVTPAGIACDPATASPGRVVNTYDEARSGYFNVGHLTTTNQPDAVAGGQRRVIQDYDAGGRQARVGWRYTGIGAFETLTSHWPMGEVKAVTYPKGITVGTDAAPWRYDRAGRLTLIPGLVSAIVYRPNGSTEAIAYGNGVTTAFAYDPTRTWLTTVTHKRSNNTILREVVYQRNAAGRVTKATWYLGSEIEVSASGSWVVTPHPGVTLVLLARAPARAAPPQDRHCLGHWFFDHRTPAGCRGIGLARESIFGIMMDMISN